jgi:chaperonin GroES
MPNAANRLQDAIEAGGAELERVEGAGPLTLAEILEPNVNLAEILTEEELATIGSRVTSDLQIDEASRGKGTEGKGASGYLERYQRWLDMAMQVKQAKNFPWPNAANVKFPLLTVAAIQFQARAYPAIVDGSNLVKGRVLGPDEDGTKRARADRMGQHMTWQLLYRMPGWEEDTDKLLLMEPIVGCVFRKTYFDSIANANRSEMVSSEDFVINYWAKSLETAPRFTHILRYYPHEVLEKIQAGLWLEISPAAISEDGSDEEALVEFYEQHRNLDLDDDGYPEPYVVTSTKDGKVVRIVPCFGKDEVTVKTSVGLFRLSDIEKGALEGSEIVKIERRQYFTKYGFIPAPDGSFYDIGFGFLLEELGETVNATINQMLNAGALQNAGGGFLSSGINHRGGNVTFRLGEWKRLDVANSTPLKDNIFHLEHPGPSRVLFSLLGMLIGAAKEITSVSEINTGTDQRVMQPTSLLALIQEGQKVLSGVLKRIHRSFGQELRQLKRLNRDYLDEEEYFQLNDTAGGEQEVDPATGEAGPSEPIKIGRADYEDRDLDVVPTSDPTMASDMQKMGRMQALMVLKDDPLTNQLELRRLYLESIGMAAHSKKLLTVPPPAPDPKVLIEGMKEARAKLESAAKFDQMTAKAALEALTAAEKAFSLGLMADAASLAAAAVSIGGTIDDDIEPIAGAGDIPGMEGLPPNAGIPAIPEGPPLGPDGGLGLGPDLGGNGGGPPSLGGGLGPIGGDQL